VSDSWIIVIAVSCVCLLMRVAVPLSLGEHPPERLARALDRAIPALLAALVVTGTFANGQDLVIDPRLAGLAAGGLVVLTRRPMVLAMAVACVVTAVVRLLL
jgi:branched-subunit amino acid transport protein